MVSMHPPCRLGRLVAALVASAALSACSGPQTSKEVGHLGFGTPGVSSYLGGPEATDLQALQARCRQVPQPAGTTSQIEGLPAACAQLQRTGRNNPGNSVQPNPLK